jgi:hypothetical protein
MRINEHMRFPYPVLSKNTKDYLEGNFNVKIEVSESRSTGKISIKYDVELSEPSISKLVDNNEAALKLFVVGRHTFYNELHDIKNEKGDIEFNKGELLGPVILRPLVCAISDIYIENLSNLNEEFREISWSFSPSDIIAIGEEIKLDVGLDKLAPMETIFNLVINEDIIDGGTNVSFDEDKILIAANKKTVEGINALRGNHVGQIILLNGVYLPAIMEVLEAIKSGIHDYEGKRWFSTFAAKCNFHGVNLKDPDLLIDAQKLLQLPLLKLINSKELT